jgi:RNA polymerase sigma-70 factor (ECF subfamily)
MQATPDAPSSILRRVADGDRTAAQACIARYGALVWSLARRLSPTPSDAEDAVQEIFLDVWKSAARFDPATASETTFVAMIARRRLIDRKRARGRRFVTEPLEQASEARAPAEAHSPRQMEACAEATFAARAVQRLRPEQQRVLLMSTCQGMSHDEIARSLGMPLGTVKAHARRALIAVRDALFGPNLQGAS